MPDRAAKNSLLSDFANTLYTQHLEPATEMGVALLMPPGIHHDETVRTIAQWWADRDPLAASALALDQPDGPMRIVGLQSVASKWLSVDPPAATKCFNALPDDPQKSQALSGAIRLLVYGDKWGEVDDYDALAAHMSPASLTTVPKWIGALDNPTKREEAYEAFAGLWLKRDPQAAKAWLNTAPLPQAHRERLLRPPPAKAQSSEVVPEAHLEVSKRYFIAASKPGAAPDASHDLKRL